MKLRIRIACAASLAVLAAAAQQQPAPGGRGQGQGRGGGAPGRGSASVRWEPWSAMRSAAGTILGWQIGVAFRQLTFFAAAEKADLLGLANIEASSSQKVNLEIPKDLGYNLAPGEIAAVKDRLNALSIRMAAYRVPTIPPAEDGIRKLFDFARSTAVGTVISERTPESLPLIDKLANEYNLNVALGGKPATVLSAVSPLTKRMGAYGDTGAWREEGVNPVDAVTQLKDRLLVLNVRDPGTASAAWLPAMMREMYRLQLKPALITVSAAASGDPSPALERSLQALEKAIQPLMAEQVAQLSKTTPIRGPDRLTPEERKAIDDAIPKQAQAPPKKARKLLVLDLNVAYPGHRSIPAENFGIEQMGRQTGAYEAVFNNDLDNLKYDKIRQYDAVFLNNTVGMLFVDPEVRDGLTRFVREGGGLAGNHGVSHASMDWPEFSEMIGVRRGVHREATEQAWIRVEDPNSPLTAPFGGKEFLYQDEFFRFPNPPYSRDKLHVLLSMDVAKTDMNQGRPCASPCVRPDADYAVSWIRNYGKGRVFFCILGHNPTVFTTPPLARYFLNGIQFILGDLEANAAPSGAAPGHAARGK